MIKAHERPQEYLNAIRNKFSTEKIRAYLDKLRDLKILVIGDTILDSYVYVTPKGRAIKDPILSVEFCNQETYAGGILAIANHLSSYVQKIKLITLLGDIKQQKELIQSMLARNIELTTFIKKNSPTTVKKRFVDTGHARNNKLFKIEYMNDRPISEELTESILNCLDEELTKYDLVVVGDFGHGFVNDRIRRKLEEKSKFLAINVQSNSANMGYNYITSYQKHDYITMDSEEIRLPFSMRFEDIEDVIAKYHQKTGSKKFIVTRGKNGSAYVQDGKIYPAPVLISTVKDTVGAGDALFAITTLFAYLNAESELIPFIGNCAGGIAANVLGNKESVTKESLLNFVKRLYENGMA